MKFSDLFSMLKETYTRWNEAKVPRLGAALAFYSIFSIAPLVLIVISVAGLIFGAEAARGEVVDEIKGTVGETVAKAIESMLVDTGGEGKGILGTVIGVGTLLIGAACVFGSLQDALNTVWEVAPKPGRGIWGTIKDRFLSLTMVFGTGFLLLVSLVLTALLAGMGNAMSSKLPGGATLWIILNFTVSFAVVGMLFAMIFKYLPDAEITWRDVRIGAVLTTLLFAVGKFALGWYLGRPGTTSAYGAAGSLVIILFWVYYASQIMLFGAE